MNNLFKKIAIATVGLVMAIGVGVGVESASGSNESTKVEAATATYTKLSAAPSDWSGTYLIGATTKSWVMKSTDCVDAKTNYASDSKFNADDDSVTGDYSAYEFTIAKYSTGYTIATTGDSYIYGTSGSNVLNIGSTQTAGTFSFISKNEINYASNTSVLRANDRFRFYKSSTYASSPAVTFYKKESATKYTVSFDANNTDYTGSTPSSITQASAGAAITLPSALSCDGYTWLGWNTSSSGGPSTRKTAGSSYTPDRTRTLYGEWSANTPAVTVSPTEASGYRGQTVTLTAEPNAYITPEKYVWTTTNASIAKLGDSSSTSVETESASIVVTYGGDSSASATVTVKGVDETHSKETAAVSCSITVTASTHSLTLSPNTAQSISVGDSVSVTATSSGTGAYASANVTATTSDATKVTVDGETSVTKASGQSFTLGGVAAGSATITFTTPNGDSETLSVTVDPSIYGTYKLCADVKDLEANAFYVISASKDDGNGKVFLANDSNTNNRKSTTANISSSQVEVAEKTDHTNEIMVVKLEGSTGAWKFHTKNYGGTDGYFANPNSGDNNYLYVNSTQRPFTISFNASNHATEPYAAVITATAGSNRNIIRYNTQNNGLFSCYSTGQNPVYLYKMIDVVPIKTLEIPETHGSSGDFYEGQEWIVEPTYNEDATTKTSELQIVSGGNYIEVDGLTVTAKAGVITDPATSATATIKAVATDGSGTESENCTITITKASVTGVEVTTGPTKTEYVEGQTLDLTGMVTTLTWNHGGTTTLNGAASGLTTTPSLSTHLTIADHDGIEVSVTYAGITSGENDGFEISVIAKAVSTIKSWTDLTTTYAIGSKLVADGSIVVTYNDGSDSEPLSVAELWANSEVTFKLDGTNVTPGTTELTSSDNGKNLTITYSGHQKSVALTVKNINYQFLTRIESTSDLVAGETYIIAARHGGKTYVMTSEVVAKPAAEEWSESWSDTYEIDSVNYTVDSLRADLATWGWTLGGSSGNWTFTGADGKNLSYGSSTNFNSTGTNTWTIAASGIAKSGYWKIANTGTSDRVVTFRGGDYMVFAPYSNSNPQGNTEGTGEYHYVELYRVYDVANSNLGSWSDNVASIDEITCNSAGSYEFDSGKSWSTMTSAFNNANYDIEVRAYIKHASYTYDGVNVTATYGTDYDVAEFVCKYDYIVDKYKWTDFIGRNGTTYDLFNSSERISPLTMLNVNSNATIAAVIISIISVTAIGGYFFLRKKKED